jgi:hypothetical protein
MKTKLIIVLLLISSNLSYAQIVKSIGIKSGITLSNQNWKVIELGPYYNFESSSGYYEALSLAFIDKEYWEVAAEVGLYQSNSKAVINPFVNYEPYDTKYGGMDFKFGFLSISPVYKFKIPIKSFTPYVLLAPRMDYYFSALSNTLGNAYKSDIRKPIWGFSIGEGISYRLNNISFLAEYQFFYSFNPLIDHPSYDPHYSIQDIIQSNTHIISLGIKYHFIKK